MKDLSANSASVKERMAREVKKILPNGIRLHSVVHAEGLVMPYRFTLMPDSIDFRDFRYTLSFEKPPTPAEIHKAVALGVRKIREEKGARI